MDSATQVDLANEEVPAKQVVDSVLEEAADYLKVNSAVDGRFSSASRSPRKHSRGASATTNQIRLKPKRKDRSPSPLPEKDSNAHLERGSFEGKGATSELQPVDRGFGAWSYVAAAFAMYIVVWGKSPRLQSAYHRVETNLIVDV
jgi:hypothetical protein